MTRDEIKSFLHLASQLFPEIGFPNKTESAEWAKAIAKFPLRETEDALRGHWKDPERKQARPRLGSVLARLQGLEVTRPPDKSLATLLGEGLSLDKLEAVLVHFRDEWFRYAKNANDRLAGMAEGPEADRARAFALVQGEGARRARRSKGVSCLVSAGVDFNAARSWSECIFLHPRDFDDAIQDYRANGMLMAPPSPPRRVDSDLLVVFQPSYSAPPGPTKREYMEKLAESLLPEVGIGSKST